jgi:hypothetical protein
LEDVEIAESAVLIKKPEKTIKRDEMGNRRAESHWPGPCRSRSSKGQPEQLADGGYIVWSYRFGYAEREALFACSAFDELVSWMRRQWVMPHPYANISPSPLQS